jgi:hypothetical protein
MTALAVTSIPVPTNYLEDEGLTLGEFINPSAVQLHAMFVTNGEGVIPGTLTATASKLGP